MQKIIFDNISAVLIDLDGTFADTTIDMCNALNNILLNHKFKKVDCDDLKYHISKGAIGIIEYAEKINQRALDSSLIRAEFLNEYSQNCFIYTTMIDGMDKLISDIEKQNIKWGIVTNKHSKYVNRILKGLNVNERLHCLVTGDMVESAKPEPDSLLMACNKLKINPSKVLYIGDDERDIIAAKKAGIKSVAANFGFIQENTDIRQWDADFIINKPTDLIKKISNN
tara:strand:+ start:11744 stop:12421 length:678 start_codon:yes stop_codon:yes gene_type:complete